MRRVWMPVLIAVLTAGVGCKAMDGMGKTGDIVGAKECEGAPFTEGTVVYRLLPCEIDKAHLKNGLVVTEGLPDAIKHGIAAQTYENRWYAKRIFYVPGQALLKVTTKTRLQYWIKVDGAGGYLMQFFSAAKDDNVKKNMTVAKQGEWEKVDLGVIADMGFEIGDDVSELAWHIGKPGDDKVSLVVCNVVFYEPTE